MNEQRAHIQQHIQQRTVDGAVIVEVVGELDQEVASALRAAVLDGLEQAAGTACVVDLTDVTYLGSSGLSALIAAARDASGRSEALRIVVDANRPVIRPIEITGVDKVLSLYHSVAEALGSSSG